MYPSVLVVPVQSFTSRFSELGCLTIKEIFKQNKTIIDECEVKEASSLKKNLEKTQHHKNNKHRDFLDILNFYPSVSHSMIEKAANYFSRNLN